MTRDHHYHGAGIQLPQPGEGLQPVESRHLYVEKHQVGAELGVDRDCFAAGARAADRVALVLEDLLQRLADTGFVVNHQNALGHCFCAG